MQDRVFSRDIDGVKVELKVSGFEVDDCGNPKDNWCKCDYKFTMGNVFSYSGSNAELVQSYELEILRDELGDLLNDRVCENQFEDFTEPDFTFELYPGMDEVTDVSMDWHIHFWADDGALTAHSFTIALDREDIQALYDYLVECTKLDPVSKVMRWKEDISEQIDMDELKAMAKDGIKKARKALLIGVGLGITAVAAGVKAIQKLNNEG